MQHTCSVVRVQQLDNLANLVASQLATRSRVSWRLGREPVGELGREPVGELGREPVGDSVASQLAD